MPVDVHLDSSSRNPWLYVSEDKLKVYELHEAPLQQWDNLQQFDKQQFILGIKGFSTGRHYWEVKVPAKGKWRLGVAAASVQRKGRFYIASGTGYWTICNRPENLHACTDPRTKLPNSAALQGLGFMWTMRMDKCPSIMLKAGSISILSQRLLEKCFSLFLLVSKGTLCYKSVHHKCLYLMENKSQQELT